MAQTSKEIREAYNKRAYKQFTFRVRRDSDLARWLQDYKDAGNTLNELIVGRLNEHFKHLVRIGVLDNE